MQKRKGRIEEMTVVEKGIERGEKIPEGRMGDKETRKRER